VTRVRGHSQGLVAAYFGHCLNRKELGEQLIVPFGEHCCRRSGGQALPSPLQDRHDSVRAAPLTTVFCWACQVPSFNVETRSWLMTAAALAIFLLPHMGSR
jgi:hypothetical protein